jgi:hypothetical protein
MSSIPPHSAAADIHQNEYPLHPPNNDSRPSASSSSGRTARSTDEGPSGEQEDLQDPSDRQYKKAGVLAAATAGTGVGAAALLAKSGNREPEGWQNVEVEGKHHIWHNHPGINDSRKQAAKVRQAAQS